MEITTAPPGPGPGSAARQTRPEPQDTDVPGAGLEKPGAPEARPVVGADESASNREAGHEDPGSQTFDSSPVARYLEIIQERSPLPTYPPSFETASRRYEEPTGAEEKSVHLTG